MIRVTKIPITVRLLLTNRCNLNCSFCINASGKSGRNELNTEEWLEVFEELRELKVFKVLLSGGEIFLRKDIFELLTALKSNRMHQISILTNGSLLNSNSAGKLKELNIKNVAVSLDGMESKHDEIRGTGAFKRSVDGIKALIEAGIVPQVSFTPVRSNYTELDALADMCHSLGVRLLVVNTLTPEGRCDEIYNDMVLRYPEEVGAVVKTVKDKRELYPEMKIECGLDFYYYLPESFNACKDSTSTEKRTRYLKEGCGAASTSCTVTAEGDIVPCEGLVKFVGGNVRSNSIDEVWNAEVFRGIRDLGKVSTSEIEVCSDCKYNVLCNAGCRGMAFNMTGNLRAPDYLCPYSKGKSDSNGYFQGGVL